MRQEKQRFILDEWLWHDLNGENGNERRAQALEFLEKLPQKCDIIVSLRNSAFEQKFYQMCQRTDVITRSIVRFFRLQIFQNGQKYRAHTEADCPRLPEGLSVKADEVYLVRLALRGEGLVVTTDYPLLQQLSQYNIPCLHRDSLLAAHFSDNT